MKYIVIDLEMCKVAKCRRSLEYHYSQEIIEIGAVMMDENYQMIDLFDSYVSPVYGQLDDFIRNLTHITEANLRHAPSLSQALESFADWCGSTEDVIFYAWSGTDFAQIEREIRSKKINGSFLPYLNPDLWMDYQQIFADRFAFDHAVSLENAMDLSSLQMEGQVHSGLDDAYNTARMISKLEREPHYELPEYWRDMKKGVTESLSFSLGDLFAGIQLAV